MISKIVIETTSTGPIEAEIDHDRNPGTAAALLGALPIESSASCWGEEVYFTTRAAASVENSQEEVEIGELAYWPPGNAFCIFFGRTPASSGNKPRAASPVNVFGKITGDPMVFKKIKGGEKITVREG